MRLDIRYVTRFDYGSSVVESQNELRACPASDDHQQVVHYRVTTTPASRVSSYIDYWGTRVDTFGIASTHELLEVVAAATVETAARPEPGHDVPLSALEDAGWRDTHLEYLQRSPHVAWAEPVAMRARGIAAGATDVRGLVTSVEQAVGGLEYRRGRTVVGVRVEEVLSAGAGVCQDFAHLTIAMLRVLGVPARYVSGYFFTVDDSTGAVSGTDEVEVETHAWVEAAVPGFGWWAVDPTNRQPVGERHVTIGRGRDYDDVAPLRGVFNGAPEHQLQVKVSMRRLALEPLGTPGAPGLFPRVDAVSGLPARPTRTDHSASRPTPRSTPGPRGRSAGGGGSEQ
jgi:transglutaminase-like putative cysteine protease